MNTEAIAKEFCALLREGRDAEAQARYWSDDVASVEFMPGPMAHLKGRAAVLEKHAWWNENVAFHGGSIEGPWINGDQFAVVFEVDATMKGQPRATMREVAVYTVRDGKVVEERFFGATTG